MLGLATALAFLLAAPAWSAFPGTNGKIAFARFPRTLVNYEEIYTINPNGSGLTRLTNSGGAKVSNVRPDWSADGTRIAYEHDTSADSVIRIIQPNGTPVDSFGDPTCAGGAVAPSWAPNGTTLAYVCIDGHSGWYVKTYDLVSHSRIQITPSGGYESDPEYSPNGDAITFSRELNNGASSAVVIADLDLTGNPTGERVVAGDTTDEAALNPDWSPADRIVYACQELSPLSDPNICKAQSTAPYTETTVFGGPNGDQFPAYAPSGNRVVFDSGPEDGDTELKVKNLTSGNVSTITSNAVVDEEADWGIR